jgi:hypothetical protein
MTASDEEESLSDEEEIVDGGEEGTDSDQTFLPGQRSRKSQMFQLHPEHMQHGRRAQRLRSDPATYYIPLTTGPVLPQRDHGLTYAKYCRLMLILFRPWQVAGDLQEPNETWIQAFNRFMETCTEDTKRIFNNMQVLHECKDAKDIEDHQRRDDRPETSGSMWPGENEVEEFAGEVINDNLLEHLNSVVGYVLERQAKVDADVIECLNEIERSGILSSPKQQSQVGDVQDRIDKIILPNELPLEDIWRTTYDN